LIAITLEKLCDLIQLLKNTFDSEDGFNVTGKGYSIQLCIEYVIECIPAMIFYEHTAEEIGKSLNVHQKKNFI
jgi:hypothetical protein